MSSTTGMQLISEKFGMQGTAAEGRNAPSADSEAAHGGATAEVPHVAENSIRVVWTREDEELYKDILREHGRSMVHLCAAFPMK